MFNFWKSDTQPFSVVQSQLSLLYPKQNQAIFKPQTNAMILVK